MHDLYKIDDTSNTEQARISGKEYCDPSFYPDFQKDLSWLQETLLRKHREKKAFTVMRVYDGEFLFLQKRVAGNGPKRHYTKRLTDKFVLPFKQGCYKVDVLSCQLNEVMLNKFRSVLPSPRPRFVPMDIIYGLLANKWFLSAFRNRIALIGGCEKLKVIKELMKHSEYRKYVNNDFFVDYIAVPERFACDHVDSLEREIGEKISKSNAEVFLFGMGMAKMAVAHTFKSHKEAVFIDIGCGLSALAGTVETGRPYYGSWTNYRIKGYNYSSVDPTNFDISQDNAKFL